ncbi:Uncharacterized protein TSPI_11056 [Trichinella spiralis]|uniref:Uncharacterized protein n=1 Tax=Trichinella spiralis TaxID=6334 RepID=A0ABR3KSY9_TRISP
MPIRKFDDHLRVEQQSRCAQCSSPQYHLEFQKCHVCDRLLGWSPQERKKDNIKVILMHNIQGEKFKVTTPLQINNGITSHKAYNAH